MVSETCPSPQAAALTSNREAKTPLTPLTHPQPPTTHQQPLLYLVPNRGIRQWQVLRCTEPCSGCPLCVASVPSIRLEGPPCCSLYQYSFLSCPKGIECYGSSTSHVAGPVSVDTQAAVNNPATAIGAQASESLFSVLSGTCPGELAGPTVTSVSLTRNCFNGGPR